jgi:hypothetical protein
MCRVEERIYISAEGHRSKFEEAFPCDKARKGKLCPKVKTRTTEYYPKKGIIPRNDTPSPTNPPTPTGTGSYLVQPRRPSSSGGRPPTRDGQKAIKPEIIIEFGAKNNNGKKYVSVSTNSYKRSSLGASSLDDIAVESPGSDASHTIRTGYPDAPLPPQTTIYGHSDSYNTVPTISHGYHHRHTSSTSSYTDSSRTPSLYVTSDLDYDSPTNTRSTRLPPAIHNPPTTQSSSSRSRNHANTSSAGYNVTMVTPNGYSQDPHAQEGFLPSGYQDLPDRSVSSHTSSGTSSKSRRAKDSDESRKKKHSERKSQEEEDREDDARAKEENIKQVRFELGRAEGRAKERAETLLAEKEKLRATEREDGRRRREREREREEEARRKEEEAAKARRKEKSQLATTTKRPAGSRRTSISMTPAQQDEQRRLLAAELGHMQGEKGAAEAREREERTAFLLQQQQDPSYYNPRTGGMSSKASSITRRDSLSRRGSVSAEARPTMLGRSNSRRTSISQPHPPPINTQVAQNYAQPPSARTHAPPPVSFPANFNPRPTSARRSSFSSQDPPYAAPNPLSGSKFENPFAPASSTPVTIHQDEWDARNVPEVAPVTRQVSDGRYTMQRRGEDVIKAASTHSAARQATRAMSKVAGYEHDYATDSDDEVTHGHSRRRY